MQSEIFKLLSKNLQNFKQPHFRNFFDCMHFSEIYFWPKTTENIKIAQKQEKVIFMCTIYKLWIIWPSQWFQTLMKVKSCTGAVVISLHCKHDMFTYINVSHKNTAKHCIISQFHTNIKATAPY